jgi:hypothetical protein
MKLAITKKTSSRTSTELPSTSGNLKKWKKITQTKNNFYQDSICHEVKCDPTVKKSDTYKKYIKPFSHSTPEQ